MKGLFKRITSVVLIFSMIFSIASVGAVALTTDSQNIGGDVSVTGSSSLGNMLADGLTQEQNEIAQNNGYNIFSAEVEENIATVSYETSEDATLIVAIYNDTADTMVASGTAEALAEENVAEVTIDIETMPQYFYLKAFLVDNTNQKPLCTSYQCPNYTQEMQEFFAKTTEDFPEDRVLNMDENETTNFAVYNDEVVVIQKSENVNNVVSADTEADTYVIENIDESISTLQAGDIFSYSHDTAEALIVKVAGISVNGTTAEIVGADVEMDEVFDYVKIESVADKSGCTADHSTCGEGVTYVGEVPKPYSIFDPIEGEGESTFSGSFEIDYKHDDHTHITGSVNLEVGCGVKVYLTLFYQYFELIMSYEASIGISVTAQTDDLEFPFSALAVSPFPIPIVVITFTPKFFFDASVGVTAEGVLSGQVGFSASNEEGCKNLTSKPNFELDNPLEAEIYTGFAFEVKVWVLTVLVTFAGRVKLGVLVEAELTGSWKNDSTCHHQCENCIDGDISVQAQLEFELKFLENDNLSFTKTFSLKGKITDFYMSFDTETAGFTTCPYISYGVAVKVVDNSGFGIADVTVEIGDKTEFTNNSGMAVFFIGNGKHTVKAYKKGKTKSVRTIINDNTNMVVVNLDGVVSRTVVDTGSYHSGVISSDGSLYTWGDNQYGQLGNGTTTDSYLPVKVLSNVRTINLHLSVSAAITKNNDLYMWGYNNGGQLGVGGWSNKTTPTKVLSNVASVHLGNLNSAAVTHDGDLYVWGGNFNGQVGNGAGPQSSSTRPVKILENVVDASLGSNVSGAVTSDGSLYMWGANSYGQVGNGTTTDQFTPVKVLDNVKSVEISPNHHTVAITYDNELYAWGRNDNGQVGNSTTVNQTTPKQVLTNVKSVQVGNEYNIALTFDGTVYVWGDTYYGALGTGYGSYGYISYPKKLMEDVAILHSGYCNTWVTTNDGDLYCWGRNDFGQLGVDSTNNVTTPTKLEETPKKVVGGYNHSLMIDADGKVKAAGENKNGELGNGTTDDSLVFAPVSLSSTASSFSLRSVPAEKTATFSGLKANEIYNFYSVKQQTEENIFGSENLLYITQAKTDESGNLTVTYTPDEICDTPVEFIKSLSKIDISQAEITVNDFTYNAKEQCVEAQVIYNNVPLVEGVDYTLAGEVVVKNAGNYTVYVVGLGEYSGSLAKKYVVNSYDISLADEDYMNDVIETGEEITPDVNLTIDGTKLIKDVDYTLSYENNVLPGSALIKVTGIGSMTGTREVYFYIRERMYGDFDDNWYTDINDVTLLQKYLAEIVAFNPSQIKCADVNNDGKATIKDATVMQLYIAGAYDYLPLTTE